MQLIGNTRIGFIGKRKASSVISGIIAIHRFDRHRSDRQDAANKGSLVASPIVAEFEARRGGA